MPADDAHDQEFRGFCEQFFVRLCRGYAGALDGSLVRAWVNGPKSHEDFGGNWVMSARMFPALAAWLAHPDRPRRVSARGQTIDLEELASAVLERAFDPAHPAFWGRDGMPATSQRTVESSVVGYAAWLLRDSMLPRLEPEPLENLQRWLEHFTSRAPLQNNWSLFWIVNHAARRALGWTFDPDTIEQSWVQIESLHRGDGWMTDGAEQAFDDYNWWVFGTHSCMALQLDAVGGPDRRERVRGWLQQRLEAFPFFFAADGSYPEFGRSLSYKFARLGFPLLGYQLGLWPHGPGMLKRLVRLHLSHYDNLGAIDRHTDVVRQTLSEFGHPDVRERYIDTGHPYWCMQPFWALWQLPDDDPLWTVPEEPLPVERADFRRVVAPAGWILTGENASGQVQRHTIGSHAGGAKYGKFLYGSHFPVNVGRVESDVGADAALCVTDGDRWAHPGAYEAFAATQQFLRGRYAFRLGAVTVACETVIVPDGNGAVRTHRLDVPDGTAGLRIVEGGAPLGYGAGVPVVPSFERTGPWSMVFDVVGTSSWIYGVSGYDRALRPQGFRGRDDLNAVHQFALTPMLARDGVIGRVVLVCYAMASAPAPGPFTQPEPPARPEVDASWDDDGTVTVTVAAATVVVPPLPRS